MSTRHMLTQRARNGAVIALWGLAQRIPARHQQPVAAAMSRFLHRIPIRGLRNWEAAVSALLGREPTAAERRKAVEHWARNLMMSMSLARWTREEILGLSLATDEDVERLRSSSTGPGLVLALPHMGSWDLAGAWASTLGFDVVAVAERLPGGLYRRFRDARQGMGMTIHPVGTPGLMRVLGEHVAAGRLVCLLSDRDLSGHGLEVPWPAVGGDVTAPVPAGPALLARATGADLRIATTAFVDGRVRICIGDVVDAAPPIDMMTEAAARFTAAITDDPTSWLMFQRWRRDPR